MKSPNSDRPTSPCPQGPPRPPGALPSSARSPRTLTYTAVETDRGRSVGFVLRQRLNIGARALRHAKFADGGCIFLDGAHVHTDLIVKPGQVVSIIVGEGDDELSKSTLIAHEGTLDIVYEDDDVVVVNKPAGLSMYPGPGHAQDTLGTRMLAHFEKEGLRARLHAVHRLDKGTSGLVVIATNPHAQQILQRQLHTNDFERTYLALVHGRPEPRAQSIMLPIGRDPACRERFCVREDGKYAVTDLEVLDSADRRQDRSASARSRAAGPGPVPECSKRCGSASEDAISLLRLKLRTGRTHQIRVHLSYLGYPLVGDTAYGAPADPIGRPALHSSTLAISQPVTGEHLRFTAPLPEDMRIVCDRAGLEI